MNRTFSIIKPDAVKRNLIGEIISRVEAKGFVISKLKMIQIDKYHHYMIGKFGPVIKYEKEGNIEWKSVIKNIDLKKHNAIISSHPSPLSCNKLYKTYPAFNGSKPFSQINKILEERNSNKIEW